MSHKHPTPFKCLVFIIFICALSVAWVGRQIPPLQSPDENSHVIRAYLISQGEWGLTTPPGQSSGHYIDQGLVEFIHAHLQNTAKPEQRFTEAQAQTLGQLTWQNKTVFYPIPGTGFYLPIIYLPQATGWYIARAINLPVAQSYELARSLNYSICTFLILLAYFFYRPPLVTSLMLVLPMSLFQLHQPSIDGLSHALLLLLLCIQAHWLNQEQPIKNWSLWIWGIGAIILIGCRLHALPLLGCLLMHQQNKLRQRFWVMGLALCAVTLWLSYAISHTVDLRIATLESPTTRLIYYLNHPLHALQKIGHTLSTFDLWLFYSQSWMGILGWLEVRLPNTYYWTNSIIFMVALIRSWQTTKESPPHLNKLYPLMGLASTVLIFVLLLLTWTPLNNPIIEGVQGRYFLIPTIIASFAFARGTLKPFETIMFVSLSLILNLFVMTEAISLRYH